MKKIVKTRAFVLQKYAFQESSFVCHCFSEQLGKVKFILRGATRKQSKLSNYQLGSIIEIDTSYHQKKEWLTTYQNHTLLEIIPDSYKKFCFLSFVLEFIFRADFDESNSAKIFSIYQNFYRAINDSKFFFFFLLQIFSQLIQIIGFYPRFQNCLICKKKTYKNQEAQTIFRKENYALNISQSAIVCSECHHGENFLNAAHIKLFLFLQQQSTTQIAIERISTQVLIASFQALLDSYAFYYPIQNFKSLSPLLEILGIPNLNLKKQENRV